jgi:hypothetical protein
MCTCVHTCTHARTHARTHTEVGKCREKERETERQTGIETDGWVGWDGQADGQTDRRFNPAAFSIDLKKLSKSTAVFWQMKHMYGHINMKVLCYFMCQDQLRHKYTDHFILNL